MRELEPTSCKVCRALVDRPKMREHERWHTDERKATLKAAQDWVNKTAADAARRARRGGRF